MVRLNLGCGKSPLPGYVNIDVRPGPGVDLQIDLNEPKALGSFETGSVEEVRALNILEHIWNWESLVLEVARVLRAGGRFAITVPFRTDFVPFHVRHFDVHSFDPFCSNIRIRTLDLRSRPPDYPTLELEGTQYFQLERAWTLHFYPFSWHLARRFGERMYRIPLRRPSNIRFGLVRNANTWPSPE